MKFRTIMTKAFLATAMAIAMTFAFAIPASAATSHTTTLEVASPFSFTLPSIPEFLGLLITVVLPLIVGLVTRRDFKHKSLVLLALAAANGFLVELANTISAGGSYEVLQGLLNAVISFGLAVILHYGVYKSEGVTEKVQQYGPQ